MEINSELERRWENGEGFGLVSLLMIQGDSRGNLFTWTENEFKRYINKHRAEGHDSVYTHMRKEAG